MRRPLPSSLLPLILLQLLNKSIIGMNNSPPSFDQTISILITHTLMLDEVGNDKTDRPGDSSQTMDHNAGLGKHLLDPIGSIFEMHANIIFLMIISRYLLIVRDIPARMLNIDSPARSQQSFYSMFYIEKLILLSVLIFSAASRFPMKIPPLPSLGSTMHE